MADSRLCSICNKTLGTSNKFRIIKESGLKPLLDKSLELNDGNHGIWIKKKQIVVHNRCRTKYVRSTTNCTASCSFGSNENVFQDLDNSITSSENCEPAIDVDLVADECEPFNFEERCFICSGEFSSRKDDKRTIKHDYMKSRILEFCRIKNDDVSKIVRNRISEIDSLVDMNVKYHNHCYRQLSYIPTGGIRGVHLYDETDTIFREVCEYIETTEKKIFSLQDLKSVMGEYEISVPTLFKKLKQQYGEDIEICQNVGNSPTILYQCSDLARLCVMYKVRNSELSEDEKELIVEVAGTIVRTEINKKEYETKKYPKSQLFLSKIKKDCPKNLNTFLCTVMNKESHELKRNSIAHAIISTVRPKTFISTLMLSVGTYIYRKTGCKIAIDVLERLGFSTSYYNLQLYEASTIMNSKGMNVDMKGFVQFVFDNTDHNVQTIDGHRSFHCMGD